MASRKAGTSSAGADGVDVRRGTTLSARTLRADSRVQRIEKRDGREVAFDVSKIEGAILAALDAVDEAEGTYGEGFAREVAGVVELALLDRGARRVPKDPSRFVPNIEEIQDLVERALMDLSCPAAAKAYILYRDQRARIRSALRVHRTDARGGPLRVREAEGVSPWSKGRIVAALVEEAELPQASAEEVAAAVERRVFASGLERITTGLIRELVAGELLERGWTHALARQDVVGIARHDLRTLLREGTLVPFERERTPVAGAGGNVGMAISGELLRRYVLEDVLPDDVAELHRAGDLHVIDLERPYQPLSIALDAELLSSGGSPGKAAFAVIEGVAELVRGVSRTLVLERPATVLAPLVRAARGGSPRGLSTWLAALGSVARASGVSIHLGSSGPRYTAFTQRLVEELGELPSTEFAPALYLEGHELEDLLATKPDLAATIDRLFADGRLWSVWGNEQEAFAGPGCHRRQRERSALACGGAVALNLPRLARRAGPWREEIVQAGLAELVQASLQLARAMDRFQRTIVAGGSRSGGLFTRTSFAIVPVGLREALLHLGQGELDPDQGARLLGLLSEAARRFGLEGATTVAPCSFFGASAAARFAWLDRRTALVEGGRQHRLFADDAAGDGGGLAYSHGFALAPLRGEASGRSEAEALRTLPVGALAPSDLVSPYDPKTDHPHLAAWRRFEVLRRSHAGELTLELFPTPPPDDVSPRRPAPLRPLA